MAVFADPLPVDRYLEDRGWSECDRGLSLSHIVCRTVYPASDLKTVRYMQENSSIGELLDLNVRGITKDHLYRISHKLYGEREGLEGHLSDMIDKMALATSTAPATADGKRIVVIDAGIATEDNLKMITGKGYDYIVFV